MYSRIVPILMVLTTLFILPLAAQRRVITSDQVGQIKTDVDTSDRGTRISVPPQEVYRALLGVYKTLDIKLAIEDSLTRQVGNARLAKRLRFAGKPISAWLNCGNSITGPRADSYRIEISLVSRVTPIGEGSFLTTSFLAVARDIAGASTDPVACDSNGRFETMIRDRVLRQLGVFGT